MTYGKFLIHLFVYLITLQCLNQRTLHETCHYEHSAIYPADLGIPYIPPIPEPLSFHSPCSSSQTNPEHTTVNVQCEGRSSNIKTAGQDQLKASHTPISTNLSHLKSPPKASSPVIPSFSVEVHKKSSTSSDKKDSLPGTSAQTVQVAVVETNPSNDIIDKILSSYCVPEEPRMGCSSQGCSNTTQQSKLGDIGDGTILNPSGLPRTPQKRKVNFIDNC